MNTLLLGLRVLLFALSTFGYLTVLHKKRSCRSSFFRPSSSADRFASCLRQAS